MDKESYTITVRGSLGASWAEWFDQARVEDAGGTTVITLTEVDRSAFYGVLKVLGDLDLAIISITTPGRGKP